MDHLTAEKRSWNMSRIKSKNTKPEIAVRSLLHKMGYRFRLHRKDLSGKPDIVLPKYKALIFVHSCFFHRHKNCRRATTPKSNIEYWNNKFARNVKRDKKVQKELAESGWNILIIWSCELNNMEKLKNKLVNFLI